LITHAEMVSSLSELECRTNFCQGKITEYMLSGSKEAFYMQTEQKSPQLVIRPAYELFQNELSQLEGTHAKPGYFHSAQMVRFPKRIYKSLTPVHYGLAFGFDNQQALKAFILLLQKICQNK